MSHRRDQAFMRRDRNFATVPRFVADLAQFLGLDINIIRQHLIKAMPTSSIYKIEEEIQRQLERLVLARVAEGQLLLVLDNAETLIDMVNKEDPAAQKLAQFIQQKLRGQNLSLLITSRYHLGWAEEKLIALQGLSPAEGASLFRQSAPSRQADASGPLANELSKKVEGQPLSLRLLGGGLRF